MFTLKGLLAITVVVATAFALWKLGGTSIHESESQPANFWIALVIAAAAFASLLVWIHEGERISSDNRFRKYQAFFVDAIAFIGFGCLLILMVRILISMVER